MTTTQGKPPYLNDEEWIGVAETLEYLADAIRTRVDSDNVEFRDFLPHRFVGDELAAVKAAIKASRLPQRSHRP